MVGKHVPKRVANYVERGDRVLLHLPNSERGSPPSKLGGCLFSENSHASSVSQYRGFISEMTVVISICF